MNRYVTNRNIWLLNIFLATGLGSVVLRFATSMTGMLPHEQARRGDVSVKPVQSMVAGKDFGDYTVIWNNDLFRTRERQEIPTDPLSTLPDPMEGLQFKGTSAAADGRCAVFTDMLSKDRGIGGARVVEAGVGDEMTRRCPDGGFSLRFLAVDVGYVRFIIEAWDGHDLADYTEDELTFEMYTWNERRQMPSANGE